MYYAAACCCNSGEICFCDNAKYASVSFLVGKRSIGLTGFENKCDRVCRRNHQYSQGSFSSTYVEAKVYMKCGGPGSIPGVFSSEYILPQTGLQKFDPGSVVILDTDQGYSLEIYTVPGDEMDCCEPPFQNTVCYDPGQRTSFSTGNTSLLPFDVLNPDGASAELKPIASTVVKRGDQFAADAPAEVLSQPNKYFRLTYCSMTYNLLERSFYYSRNASGHIEDYVNDRYCGGGFGNGTPVRRSIRKYSLIGDECDYYATGEEIVTQVDSSGFRPVPYANYQNFQGPSYCNEYDYTPGCCGIWEFRIWPATEGFNNFSTGGEANGGIYGLEFFDDPPPDLP